MRKLILIGLLMLMPLAVTAGNRNAGTSGAQFLKLGAGARAAAMGESFVAVADDASAVSYNPSGLAFIDRPELAAQRTQWFQGVDHQFGAFAYPTDLGAFALSATTLKTGDIQKRAMDETHQGSFDATDAAYAFSYARMMGPMASVGLTVRYIKEEIGTYSANAWGGDLGVIRKCVALPLTFGLAMRHFGEKIKFDSKEDPQPLTYDLGVSANLFKYRLVLSVNAAKPNDGEFQFAVGSEYHAVYTKMFRFTLRAGFNSMHTDANGAPGVSAGGGIGIRRMSLDFAWVPYGDLGNTFRYSLGFRF